MESNVKRVEEALERLSEAAEKAKVAVRGGSVYDAPLETVTRLTPDALRMVMALHTEIADKMAEDLDGCGMVIPELVEVLNGLKDFMETVQGGWYFEEGRWHDRRELRERAARARMEVAQ